MESSRAIPFAIVAGGVILAIAVYFAFASSHRGAGQYHTDALRPVTAADHIFGNPSAPVKIVEYADFECTYCKGFDDTLHQIIANDGNKGRVAWVYREFPLTEVHPNALTDAEAAECAASAGGNDAFWSYASLLFQHQPVNPTDYGAFAVQAGVPSDAFAACMANAAAAVDPKIESDRANAVAIGASGTPYSLIIAPGAAPVVVDSAYSYDALKALVDQAIAGQ
jgi:protein-disulfide isomerase